jgi:hypothetical protein
MRRVLAAYAVTAALATSLVLVSPQPAKADVITGAQGCGTTLTIGLDASLLIIPGWDKTYNNVRFECVLALKQFDIGFAAFPLGAVGAGGAKINIFIENTTSFLGGLEFTTGTPGQGIVDACIPIAFGVSHTGSHPNDQASFTCLSLRTFLNNGQPDPGATGFLPFQIVNLNWHLDEGDTVNGLGPLGITGIGFIDDFIVDIVVWLIGGGIDLSFLTDGPVVNTKPLASFP